MARTLYIIEDATLKSLDSVIRTKLLDEVRSLFAFAPIFTIRVTLADNIPERIDFTDSIVKLVAKDADVTAVKNQAEQQQHRFIESMISRNKLNVRLASLGREAGISDRGGVGWQNKEVLPSDNQKIAVVQTGGIVSVETAVLDALTHLAPNRWTLKEAQDNRDKMLRSAERAYGNDREKKEKAAHTSFEKSKLHWALQDKAPKNWPSTHQSTLGLALGRIIAHEARHQYVAAHFEEGGLGGESAEVLDLPSSATFHTDDQKAIAGQLTRFETLQKTATLHLETFPKGKAFAFKE